MARGRRPGPGTTRDQVLAAATDLFARRGFEGTTIRAIAEAAGVDPAMVGHYFGTKDELFRAVIGAPLFPETVLPIDGSVPRARLGAELLRRVLAVWESPAGAAVLAVARSAVQDERFGGLVREFLFRHAVGPVVAQVESDPARAQRRAALVLSQFAGLLATRYLVHVEPLASATQEQVVDWIAPTLQHYLTGELGGAAGDLDDLDAVTPDDSADLCDPPSGAGSE